jgi:hypothetical protein
MPKELVAESRFDFRGGLNTYLSPDLLNENELSKAENARIDNDGKIVKRTGSRRLHQTALAAAPIVGVTQWDAPAGSQIVAICNGDLFYRAVSTEFSAFTQVDPGTTDAFSTQPATFAVLRGATDSAPLRLYIASGGKLYEWDGTTLTRLDGVSSSLGQFAPDAQLVASYHLRLFCNSVVRPQHLVWSRLGDGRVFKGGLAADGGTAMVSAVEGDPITALLPLGRSLLVGTKNSLNRVAGYLASDIQIDQDLEGISPDIGPLGRQTICRVERLAAFVASNGIYLASEGATTPIGLKIKPTFDGFDQTYKQNAILVYHEGRNEVWVFYTGTSDNGANKSALVFNTRHQAWYGPFMYENFAITSACAYQRPDNIVGLRDNIIAGCADGFIRLMDYDQLFPVPKDDRLYDDSGGTGFHMRVILPPIFFSNPAISHSLRSIFLQASSPDGSTATIDVIANFQETVSSPTSNTITFTSIPTQSRRVDQEIQGRRLIIELSQTGTNDKCAIIHGLVAHAHVMNRLPTS